MLIGKGRRRPGPACRSFMRWHGFNDYDWQNEGLLIVV